MELEKTDIATDSKYNLKEIPLKGVEGIKLAAYEGIDLAAIISYTRIIKPDDLPDQVRGIIGQKGKIGVPTFLVNVTVVDKFQGKGIGTTIWREARRRLIAKYPKIIESVIDDSISPSSTKRSGWTERRVRASLENHKDNAVILFQGEIDRKAAWLIEFQGSVLDQH